MPTLAQARHRKSLTQQRLADSLGVRQSLVSAWERGISHPTPGNLDKLCQILEIALEEIEFLPRPEGPRTARPGASREEIRRQIEAYDESMGYVDSTWLRGGRYDIDPASHEPSET